MQEAFIAQYFDTESGAWKLLVIPASALKDGEITDAKIADTAAIALTKLATGILPSGIKIVDANVNAGISQSKIANLVADLGALDARLDDVESALLTKLTNDLLGDWVVSGLLGTDPGASLTMTTPGGVAYIAGQRFVSAGFTHTYAPSSDTYDDLAADGTVTHTAVANGAPAPAVAPNAIRLQKVVTNATEITGVTDLRVLSPTVLRALTLTAALTLAGDPVGALEAAPRQYVDPARHGQCRLRRIGSVLELMPYNGNRLVINGRAEVVTNPVLGTGGLLPNTTYNIYAYMNAGTMALEASTTGHIPGPGGVEVKAGAPFDTTRTFVGTAATDGSLNWVATSVRSWFHPVVALATKAEMEAGSDTDRAPSVDSLKHHKGVAKAWVRFDPSGTILESHGVSSVTDIGTGNWQVHWATPFATSTYVVQGTSGSNGTAPGLRSINIGQSVTTSTHVSCRNDTNGLTDPEHSVMVAAWGIL